MARGRDPGFDGSYETSRYAKGSLEDDIARIAFNGVMATESPTGGLEKTTYYPDGSKREDSWEKGKPGEYTHTWNDEKTGDSGSRSDKR